MVPLIERHYYCYRHCHRRHHRHHRHRHLVTVYMPSVLIAIVFLWHFADFNLFIRSFVHCFIHTFIHTLIYTFIHCTVVYVTY